MGERALQESNGNLNANAMRRFELSYTLIPISTHHTPLEPGSNGQPRWS